MPGESARQPAAGSDCVLSVVVAIVSDTIQRANADHLRCCLRSLVNQVNPPAMEIVAPHHPDVQGIGEVREEFPGVRFLEVCDLKRYTGQPGGREHHNELRARGIAAARGDLIALLEDHGVADPNWCARIVVAHAKPVAGIGGAVENNIDSFLNWAVYFCDFGAYQNPVPEGPTAFLSDANVSYKRTALESVHNVWRDVFHEGAVNHALSLRNQQLVLAPGLVVYQHRLGLNLRTALKERFIWGWSYGAGRALTGASRLVWAGLCVVLPFVIVARIAATAAGRRRHLGDFLRASPGVALMAAAWCFGEMRAYLSGARIQAFERPAESFALPEKPRLSVVIAIAAPKVEASGSSELAETLAAVLRQKGGLPFEIIVPCDETVSGVASFESRFPGVRFLRVAPLAPPGSSERLDEVRARGVAAATGDIVALLEDHVRPDPDWSTRILEAHRLPFAAIGGAIENGVDRPLNWGAYFSDLGRYHNPLRAGESSYASVVNVSYKRAALESIRPIWERQFNETAVHWELTAQGGKLGLSPEIVVRQHRDNLVLGRCLREFFTWGRSYGSTRARLAGPVKRLIYACLAPLIPAVLVWRTGSDVLRKGRLAAAWLKSLPCGLALTTAWSCGELAGYLAGPAPDASPADAQKTQSAGE